MEVHGTAPSLTISIVVYHSDPALLARTLETLAAALAHAIERGRLARGPRLVLIDNAEDVTSVPTLPALCDSGSMGFAGVAGLKVEVRRGHGNVGYGRGHNLAIAAAQSDYFLVLNPDVELDAEALALALEYLQRETQVVLLSPLTRDAQGRIQYLCRRYPSLLDLFVRGFLPTALRRYFDTRLARYELRERTAAAAASMQPFEPPIVSGCFMLFRTQPLQALGGFDPAFFLYFEDYDLSLRAHEVGRIVYLPSVRIMHHGGGASRKGFTHIKLFMASAARFFRRHGWRVL